MTEQKIIGETTYCAKHPNRETSLRCNKCDRYMCPQCAVSTPVGYRCRECVRQQDDRFFTATNYDSLIVLAVCAGLSAIAGGLVSLLSWILVGLLLGFPAGSVIGEAAVRAIQRRRGRNNAQNGAIGVVAGGFAGAALRSYFAYSDTITIYGSITVPNPVSLNDYVVNHTFTIGLILFLGLAAYAVYIRMKA